MKLSWRDITGRLNLYFYRFINSIFYLFEKKDEVLVLTAYIKQLGPFLKHYNLGDDLNFYMFSELSGKKIYNHKHLLNRSKENIMCIGSIVDGHINRNTLVWGAGAMYGGDRKLKYRPKKVLAVRGPLTREYLLSRGVECPEVYGDPALLLPHIYKPKVEKKYKIGIIPHYIDSEHPWIKKFISDNESVRVISLTNYADWHDVIDEIYECETIISSSLHGLIISDAYSIPNLWVRFSDKIAGGDFKYKDYFASVNRITQFSIEITDNVTHEMIIERLSEWKPISYNPDKLIESCPFEIDKRKLKIIKQN